ncbi:MAG: hypothetical protein KDI51_01910 [Xanthomonadales bacterium]|nr:hypothetical protein [Xanthomonadales bacterium]
MTLYGDIALLAAKNLASHDPATAWRLAAEKCCQDSVSSRDKACPRKAFEGLCWAGFVLGFPGQPKSDAEIGENGRYAVAAARLLLGKGHSGSISTAELWATVLEQTGSDPAKRHNGQMDVVMALHAHGLLQVQAAT